MILNMRLPVVLITVLFFNCSIAQTPVDTVLDTTVKLDTTLQEASAPNKTIDQNQAALIRASINRLEYMIADNLLVGPKDPDVLKKTLKLKEDLKQNQVQLIEKPVDFFKITCQRSN